MRRLPYGKIPDRHDFERLQPDERERAWRKAVDMCRELADEFHEILETGRLAERVELLEGR